MRKTLLSLSLAAVTLTACAQHSLTVHFSDLTSDTIAVTLLNATYSDRERTDTILAKDGTATYDLTATEARAAMLAMKGKNGPAQLYVYLLPGEQGTLTGTAENATWTGTPFYTDLAKLEAATEPIQNQIAAIMSEFREKVQAGGSRDSLAALYQPKYEAAAKQLADANLAFIKANPTSAASVTALNSLNDPEEGYNVLAASALNGPLAGLAAAVKQRIDKDKARKEAAKLVGEGAVAPDFTLNDINGKPLKLSSLRGKYVVLDFWGSWCGWCIKGMPKMKEYYQKYAGKFEILGVDCNDTEAKWKAAVEKHQLPWKHVYCPKGSDLLTRYAIEGFPTKIVIGPDGKIVKTIVGEDPQFYTLLDALMK